MTDDAAFPRTADAIDAGWLERRLRAAPDLAEVSVIGCEVEPLGARSATGQLLRLRPRYAGGSTPGPATLIAKLASPHAAVRRAAAPGYAKELAFYRELGSEAGIALPRWYGGAFDAQSAEMIVLLEELPEAVRGIDRLELARRTLGVLAELHARFWESPRLGALSWLRDAQAELDYARAFVQAVPALRAALGSALPQTFAAAASLFAERFEATSAWLAEGPSTLVHGDLHLQQVHCTPDGRTLLLDWQTVGIGPGASDVARLVVSSTDPATQAAHERALLASYHAALLQHGVSGYAFEDCFEHYVRATLRSVMLHVIGAAQLDLQQFQARSAAQGRPWTERFFGWVDAALERHDLLSRLRAALGVRA